MRAARDSRAAETVLVSGHMASEVEAAVADLSPVIVHNPDFAEGLSTSLRTGLAAVGEADVSEKLLKGHKAAGKTFKVHIDGKNMLPYLSQRLRIA